MTTWSLRRLGDIERISNSPTLRFAPGRIVPAALTVLAAPILARLLSRREFGELALLQTVALLAGSAFFGWAEVLIVRAFASSDRVSESDLSRLSRPAVGGVALVVFIGSGVSAATGSVLPLLTAACAVAYASTLVSTALARSRQDPALFVACATVGLGTRFLVGVPLVALGFGITGILIAWTSGGTLALLITGRRLALGWRRFRFPPVDRDDLRFAAPVVAVSSGLLALSLADRLILSVFLPTSQIAPYALGYSVVDQAASISFSVLLASRFPAMVKTFDLKGTDAAQADLRQAILRFTALTTVPLMLLGMYGDRVIRLFGGSQYNDADLRFLPFVAVGLFLNGLHQYMAVPLQLCRKTRIWGESVAIGVVVNIAANFACIPVCGTLGAGISTMLGYGAVVLSLHLKAGAARALSPADLVRRALAVGSAGGVAVLATRMPWMASVILVAGTYFIVTAASRPSLVRYR
jgi:O-antigen/teichoic acid export membrane protein